jgi:dTDP-glucose 4,6-dehydratase
VGSPDGLTILELAQQVRNVVAPGCPIEIAGTPTPGAPPSRYVPAVERASTGLGLSVWIGLEEAIRRTAAWHRSRARATA